MAPDPMPNYVYKILPSAPPDPIPTPFPLSELDAKDGFVHLSSSWQVGSFILLHSLSLSLRRSRELDRS
jgi:hypothetical protein